MESETLLQADLSCNIMQSFNVGVYCFVPMIGSIVHHHQCEKSILKKKHCLKKSMSKLLMQDLKPHKGSTQGFQPWHYNKFSKIFYKKRLVFLHTAVLINPLCSCRMWFCLNTDTVLTPSPFCILWSC